MGGSIRTDLAARVLADTLLGGRLALSLTLSRPPPSRLRDGRPSRRMPIATRGEDLVGALGHLHQRLAWRGRDRRVRGGATRGRATRS